MVMNLQPRRQRSDRCADVDEVKQRDWSEFHPWFYREWQQGEHVALVGPTGGGKTTLAKAILPRRSHVAVLVTKPKDSTLDGFRKDGFVRTERWPGRHADAPRHLVWPRVKNMATDIHNQQRVFADVLEDVFATGHRAVYLDELRYVTETLRLQKHVQLLWLQGRSLKVSIVAATQRPAMVPLEMYDQSTHLFFWRDNDERNLKRISGIGYLSSDLIRNTVARLPKHHVLYVNTRTGDLVTTKPERT